MITIIISMKIKSALSLQVIKGYRLAWKHKTVILLSGGRIKSENVLLKHAFINSAKQNANNNQENLHTLLSDSLYGRLY